MSTEPLASAGGPLQWADCAVNHWAVVFAIIVFVLSLPDIIRLFPHLLRCIPLWKGNLDLEHSVSMARTRNYIALAAGLAFCIIADRWGLVAPSFKLRLAPEWQLPVTVGLVAGTALLRSLGYLASPFRSRTSEFSSTLRHTILNYLILLVVLMLASAVLAVAVRMQDIVVQSVLYIECAAVFLLHLMRTGQILGSRYGSLATFLYLCGLEILPVGILIFVCTI